MTRLRANENSEGQVGATNQQRVGLGRVGYKRRLRARELSDQQQEGEERSRRGRWKKEGEDGRKKEKKEGRRGRKKKMEKKKPLLMKMRYRREELK